MTGQGAHCVVAHQTRNRGATDLPDVSGGDGPEALPGDVEALCGEDERPRDAVHLLDLRPSSRQSSRQRCNLQIIAPIRVA